MVVEIYRRSLPEQAGLEHSAGGGYLDVEELLARRHNIAGYEFQALVGYSRGLRGVLNQIDLVAATDSTVLIEGETGTGKELIARAIHARSSRSDRAFVKLNCAAIPAALLENELFGHEKGAFTGAVMRAIGRFEAAHGGTLFLDEIGDMPLELQSKILRVLQEHEFERLGSPYTRRVDVRVVAATNQNLSGLVANKQFRMDLYYRLKVFPIAVPPLRQRMEDVPILAAHFVRASGARMSKEISKISSDAVESLMRYSWPGNIRELQNVVERAVILSTGEVLDLPPLPSQEPLQREPVTLAEAERDHILKALEACNWVVGGAFWAAARLGVKRTTLIDKMRRRGLSRKTFQRRESDLLWIPGAVRTIDGSAAVGFAQPVDIRAEERDVPEP